jgi:hypothetical protein
LSQPTEIKGETAYSFSWVALDKHVLLVRVKSDGVDHGAYIGAVKGDNYDEEAIGVVEAGSEASSLFAYSYFDGLGAAPVKRIGAHGPYFNEKWPDRDLELFGHLPSPVLGVDILDRHVLAVAVTAERGVWKALIGPSKGADFLAELAEIAKTGTPLRYEAAEACFQDESKQFRWHEPLRIYLDDQDFGPADEWGGGKPAVPVGQKADQDLPSSE